MVKIVVVGSISTDFVVSAERRPQEGETVYGLDFATNFGGKGANQAVATARLGAETLMLGAVGDDEFASRLLDNLQQNQIDTQAVKQSPNQASGSAVITLVAGDNAIIYVPGANNDYLPTDVAKDAALIREADMVLVQNETPEATIEVLIDLCDQEGVPLLWNPAPARVISPDHLKKITYLTPNETEFDFLFPNESIESVTARYPQKLIVTLGEKGAAYHDGQALQIIPIYPAAKVVDTTGAGDTFNGALAVALAGKRPMGEAIRFASLAASLAIQGAGAQTAIPTLKEMKASEFFEETWHFE